MVLNAALMNITENKCCTNWNFCLILPEDLVPEKLTIILETKIDFILGVVTVKSQFNGIFSYKYLLEIFF